MDTKGKKKRMHSTDQQVWLSKAIVSRIREIALLERRTLKTTIEMAIESAIREKRCQS